MVVGVSMDGTTVPLYLDMIEKKKKHEDWKVPQEGRMSHYFFS